MRYKFRPLPELYFGVLTAVIIAVLPGFLTFDPLAVPDWRAWSLALIGAIIRPAVGAVIDYMRRSMVGPDVVSINEQADQIMAMSQDGRLQLQNEIERRERERRRAIQEGVAS